MQIKLIANEQIKSIIPLLLILNPSISVEVLSNRLDEMVKQGYKCAGAYEGDELVGICGIWILTKYYVGRHIEPDNVIVHPAHQSKGIGKKLIEWVLNYGIEHGCEASELNCYLINDAGQRFWTSEGYTPIGYHYQKKFPTS